MKSIWAYEIPLWGTAAMNHINKLESLESKILRIIVNTPWYVRNEDIRKDLKIPTVKEEIGRYAKKIQKKNGNTSKPASCWSEQNFHKKKTKEKTLHWPH